MTEQVNGSTEVYRYCLSKNDEDIIKHYTDKPLSDQAKKSLIILSEVFGGLHHLDSDQLKIFDYQSDYHNEYYLHASLATFDSMELTTLVIIAHDMAVRLSIDSVVFDPSDDYQGKLLQMEVEHCNAEYDTKFTINTYLQALETRSSRLRLMFHARTREGDWSKRHPTLETTMEGFRIGNKRYH